jgi:hypothetical protein
MTPVRRAWAWLRRGERPLGGGRLAAAIVALIVGGRLLTPWIAFAEEKRSFPYPYDWVYKAAYRLLKIDLDRPIEEADAETGYILFTYEYQGVESAASLELMDLTNDEDGYRVNTRVKMSKLPSWVEQDLLDQLESKLEDEYGEPPEKKAPAPEPAPEPEGDEEPEGTPDE